MRIRTLAVLAIVVALTTPALADPLPSWRNTEAKSRIVEFVERVTDPESADFVPVADRIATFDNDGCLWAEQPVYFQLIYALDRLKEQAQDDPSILSTDPLKAAAAGDIEGMLAEGSDGLMDILAVTHANVSVEAFQADVLNWLSMARHSSTGMAYNDMVYQPMLELLSYLRDAGFQTWIVSGGGVHFVRAFAEQAYGIPPQQVVGSATPTEYQLIDGVPTIMKLPGIEFVDDKAGKPIG
ncbi:MAG: haloacid dehalogenase-like hydrolase, partial [Pseudomonadota bacterium]